MMRKKKLGKTDLEVSRIGLGTVKFGRNQKVKYPNAFAIPTEKELVKLLQLAEEFGINLLDTAPAYGNSEARLGSVFSTHLTGRRHKWIITSKAGEEFSSGTSHFDFTPEHIFFSVERTLQRLKTDYLDLLLIHSDGNDLKIIKKYGVFEVLHALKQKGLIRAGGMSTKTVAGGLETVQQTDCVMVTWHIGSKEEEPVLDAAMKNKCGILVKKSLASGWLCKDTHENSIEQSMNFVFSHPAVTSAVIGTINPQHLLENIRAACKATANDKTV